MTPRIGRRFVGYGSRGLWFWLPPICVALVPTFSACAKRVVDPYSLRARADRQHVDYPNGQYRPLGPRVPERILRKREYVLFPEFGLPIPISRIADSGSGTFRAGFSKERLNVPDGYGMVGYGTEGRQGKNRAKRMLHVRAMVLQGANGETVAFAVIDLVAVSTILHREAAALLHERTSGLIGADRLILSATHTHSAPGHFLSYWPLNMLGSQEMGFAPELAEHLAQRIADAVMKAYENLAPARAAWEVARVWGHTRNRSVYAATLNASAPALQIEPPPVALDNAHTLVNPRWAMLRVETLEDASGSWALAGAFSIFAIHATGIPGGSEYYDSDIPGEVAERVEREHADSIVYLFANSTEGDVSPNWPPNSRCPVPVIAPSPRPGGTRTPPGRVHYVELTQAELEECLAVSERYVEYLGGVLADTAMNILTRLGADGHLEEGLEVERAFTTLNLGSQAEALGVCPRPMAGTATAAGASDGVSRFNRWRVFGLIPIGTEPGGSAVDFGDGCHSPKRALVSVLQSELVGPHQFPSSLQLAAIRVGDMLLGTVPAEVTTMAGRRIMGAMQAARPEQVAEDHVAILGMTNGYMQYVTTHEEYQAQYYEGSSTLYGPNSAKMLREQLTELTHSLKIGEATVFVGPITVRPGPPKIGWPPPKPKH